VTEFRARKSTQNLNFGFRLGSFWEPILQGLSKGIGFPGSRFCLALFHLRLHFLPQCIGDSVLEFRYRSLVVQRYFIFDHASPLKVIYLLMEQMSILQ